MTMYLLWWVGMSTGCSTGALTMECGLICGEVHRSAGVAICKEWISGHVMRLYIVNIWYKYQFVTSEAL